MRPVFLEVGCISGLVMQPKAVDKCDGFQQREASHVDYARTQTLIISLMNSGYIKQYFRGTTLCPRSVIRSCSHLAEHEQQLTALWTVSPLIG